MADSQRKTANLVPPPLTPKSETVNGLTFNVKSEGIVEISGTATGATIYSYKLKTSFTMPTSKTAGGNGYLYYWNTFTSSGTIRLRYNNQQVDYWSINPINRVINKFDNAENATIDEIEIRISSGETINGSIGVMVTDNGEIASAFIPYWQHSLRKLTTATDTFITLPADLYADGNNATVGLVGNMSQTGTPTPSSPIQPSECGEKSENLYDNNNPVIFYGYYKSDINKFYPNDNNGFVIVSIEQGKKYYISGVKRASASTTVRWCTSSVLPAYDVTVIRTGVFSQSETLTITAESGENYLAIFLCGDSDYSAYGTVEDAIAANGANLVIDNGYKIPISSANTTTPVYLGEVETTRKIKKLVLTGEEGWRRTQTQRYYIDASTGCPTNYLKQRITTSICSHYQSQNNTASGLNEVEAGHFCFYIGGGFELYIGETTISSAADFKAYLAQQYANGTPVTIWYVLATETTGIVNEPLRKIGDYADTVSGITIPTITGKDTVDVETTLKPSEVELTYTGWHDASVKEWNGSDWQ